MPPPRRCRWRRCRGCVGNLPWHDDDQEGIWGLAVWFWYSWKSNSVWVGIGIPGPGSLGLLVIRVWVWEPQEAQDVVADGGDNCHRWMPLLMALSVSPGMTNHKVLSMNEAPNGFDTNDQWPARVTELTISEEADARSIVPFKDFKDCV